MSQSYQRSPNVITNNHSPSKNFKSEKKTPLNEDDKETLKLLLEENEDYRSQEKDCRQEIIYEDYSPRQRIKIKMELNEMFKSNFNSIEKKNYDIIIHASTSE